MGLSTTRRHVRSCWAAPPYIYHVSSLLPPPPCIATTVLPTQWCGWPIRRMSRSPRLSLPHPSTPL